MFKEILAATLGVIVAIAVWYLIVLGLLWAVAA
jgi:hypothetical protein